MRPVSGGLHHGEHLLHDPVHQHPGRGFCCQGAVRHAEDRAQRIQGAIVEHLRPEVLLYGIGHFAGDAAVPNGSAQRLDGREVSREQTADVDRVRVDRDLHFGGARPAKAGDHAGVVDSVLVETLAEGLGVAPAVLKEHEPGFPADPVAVFRQILRRRRGVEGLRADQDEVELRSLQVRQRLQADELLRPGMSPAEDPRAGQAGFPQGRDRALPGEDLDAVGHADQTTGDPQSHRASAIDQYVHVGPCPVSAGGPTPRPASPEEREGSSHPPDCTPEAPGGPPNRCC